MKAPRTYDATVIRWVDGDTVDLRVDVGFYIWHESRFRLYGINTPERGQPGYSEATTYAEHMAPQGTPLVAHTYIADKYGRFLTELFVAQQSINVALLQAGLAVPYMP